MKNKGNKQSNKFILLRLFPKNEKGLATLSHSKGGVEICKLLRTEHQNNVRS